MRKKILKISLVVAVGVAGFSTANTQPEQTIKDVEISGSVVYRYITMMIKKYTKVIKQNQYKIGLNFQK